MRAKNLSVTLFFTFVGLAIGVGVFTFIFARGYSYLTNDPGACANCHVMNDHFNSWVKSSHHSVAVCNDCHTPASLVPKYFTKATNGFWHSFAFTTGDFPDPLRIKPHNLEIAESACRKCHQTIVAAIETGPHLVGVNETPRPAPPDERLSCIRCHNKVGHWVR